MKKLYLIALLFLFCGCDWFEYHPYDGNISGEKGINAKNITRIEEACAGRNTIRFIMMSDTQRFYDETDAFVKAVNKRNDIDFVIHGGDVTDFALTEEFVWIRDIMNKLKVPYVTLIGNHDCIANGKEIYRTIFGDENFSFLAGNVKFICLNTNAIEYDYSHPVPDFGFMQAQYDEQRDGHEKTIVVMHAQPFCEQFNNNVAPLFQYMIKQFPQLQFCLYAHIHGVYASELFNDGVMYYSSDTVGHRSYLLFTINPDNTYTYEIIPF